MKEAITEEAIRDLEVAHVEFLSVFHKVGFTAANVQTKIDVQKPTNQEQAKRYVQTGVALANYLVEAANRLRQHLQVIESSRPFLPEAPRIIVPEHDDRGKLVIR